jgi:hypothetical protein
MTEDLRAQRRIDRLERREAVLLKIIGKLAKGLDNMAVHSPHTEGLCAEVRRDLKKLRSEGHD